MSAPAVRLTDADIPWGRPGVTRADEYERRVEAAMDLERARREARRRLDAEERGPITEPEMVTLDALLREPEPVVMWRIDGWQAAESRVMLAAARKSGKTTLVGSLVRALVDGDAWLGAAVVQPVRGRVAVIDTEMSRTQLRRWLRDQQIRHTDRVVIAPIRGQAAVLDVLDAACRARWAAWLRAREVRYLVLDCLRPVLDAQGLDESREAGRWLVGLDALLREAEIPEACIVHHMGHTGERARGDSRLRDWPDVEWRLMREDEQDASPRYLAAYGRDVDQPEARLEYDPITRRLTIAGGTRRDTQTEAALDEVLAVIGDEALTGRAIEAAMQEAASTYSRAQVREALTMGIRLGVVTTERGQRRAILHRRGASAPVRRSAPPPSSAPESECASAPPPFRVAHSAHSTRSITEGECAGARTGSEDPDGRF